MGRKPASRVAGATALAAWLALAAGPGCSSHDPLPGAKPDGQHPGSDAGSAPAADTGGPLPGTDAGGPMPGTDAGGPGSMGTDGAANPDSSAASGPDGASASPYPDGLANAPCGTPQFPNLLGAYPTRPPWHVAGVDYYAGLPCGTTLADPSTAPLPTGCTYAASTVSCSGDGITIRGFDFSLHGGMQVSFSMGNDFTVTSNRFGIGNTCLSPIMIDSAGGTVTITNNTIDGASGLCSLEFNGLVVGTNYQAGATELVEYNILSNVPEDGLDLNGPATGSASLVAKYNIWSVVGFNGHPDGIQFCGGNFDPIDVEFNTYNSPASAFPASCAGCGSQPFHIEAQCTAALNNSTVAHNTVVTPGTCMGSTFPAGCSVNADIACKQDDPQATDSNAMFAAYGNYIDWSGGLSALDNGYNCPTTSWGSPMPNYDLSTGLVLPVPVLGQ